MSLRTCLLIFTAIVVLACSGDDDIETTGAGGSSANSSSSSGAGPITCADCSDDEHCVTCNYPSGSTYSCVEKAVPTADTFKCGETTLCQTGSEVCTTTETVGDGCGTIYDCNFFPSACEATPTCECILMYEPYQASTCMDFGNGEFWIAN